MTYPCYGVRKGVMPGVYYSWDECKKNVIGYPHAEYKGFVNDIDAYQYVFGKKDNNKSCSFIENLPYGEAIAYVDGSYSTKTGVPTYGIVFISNGYENRFSGIVEDKSLHPMSSVAGELEAAICCMNIAMALNIKKLTIYHDYIGISQWFKGNCKTNKKGIIRYCEVCEYIKKHIDVNFVHVKGHSGDYYNDIADRLATQMQLKIS